MNNASTFSHVRCFLMCALLAISFNALAEKSVNTLTNSFFAKQTDTAINCYDSVAYFTQNAPVKGLDANTFEYKGAKWKFSSVANLELFKANPEKYAPQYGGYCAYGVANDSLVKVDPSHFTVLDGKLYLNYDPSIQKDWLKDRVGFIRKADSKFQALIAK